LTRNNSGVSASRASASPESAPAFPALGVVTADGGTTTPPVVLDRMATDALAANRARLESYAPLVAEIEATEGLAKSAAAARLALAASTRTPAPVAYQSPVDEAMAVVRERGGLDAGTLQRLAKAQAGIAALADQAERDAAVAEGAGRPRLRLVPPPGPVQAATPCPPWCDVQHDDPGDRFHYSAFHRGGSVDVNLDIDDDGALTLHMRTGSADGDDLILSEVDELIAVLTQLRATFADTLATRPAAISVQRTSGGAA
jgi:hypothetical protein